mmetsp:Transcript_92136/g.246290  ORF Transcript_92136/g.246290 Transcript_92136/m.246290 type:complete len:335 (+) Transcript_92136:24-1028(+)
MALPCRPVLATVALCGVLLVLIPRFLNSRKRRDLERLLSSIERWRILQGTCLRWLNILTLCRYGYAAQPTMQLASAARLEGSRRMDMVELDQPLRCVFHNELRSLAIRVSEEIEHGTATVSMSFSEDSNPTLANLRSASSDLEELIFAVLACCLSNRHVCKASQLASLLEAAHQRLSVQLHSRLARPGPNSDVCWLVRHGRMREAAELAAATMKRNEAAARVVVAQGHSFAPEEVLRGIGEQESGNFATGAVTPEGMEFSPPEELLAVLRGVREAQVGRERYEGEWEAAAAAEDSQDPVDEAGDPWPPAPRGVAVGDGAGFLAELEKALARRVQ